jgi:lysophospholipase L1-like esterase
VIVFEGTNDVRRGATAAQVMAGLQEIVTRLKAARLKAIGVTIIPRHNVASSADNTGWDAAKTAVRNAVNDWIRRRGGFDAVIDFDEVVRKAGNHDLIDPAYNCGDGIHPNPFGYLAMGRAVDLDVFK